MTTLEIILTVSVGLILTYIVKREAIHFIIGEWLDFMRQAKENKSDTKPNFDGDIWRYPVDNNGNIVVPIKDLYNFLRSDKDKINSVVEVVSNHFGFTSDQIKARSRKQELVRARAICFYILYEQEIKLIKIAEVFNLDHSTVIHGRDNIKSLIKCGEIKQNDLTLINSML